MKTPLEVSREIEILINRIAKMNTEIMENIENVTDQLSKLYQLSEELKK